jgi:hypothetical protein
MQTPRRTRVVMIAIVALAACSSGSSGGRRSVRIGTGSLDVVGVTADGRTLSFAVPTCRGKPTTRVDETTTEVHLLVTSDTGSSEKCVDTASVTLQKPLGTRKVIDDENGKRLTTRQFTR